MSMQKQPSIRSPATSDQHIQFIYGTSDKQLEASLSESSGIYIQNNSDLSSSIDGQPKILVVGCTDQKYKRRDID